jgi:signal peptidase II
MRTWLSLAAVLIVLDQLTKELISSHFSLGESLPITSFFNLVLAHNPGASFSFLSDAGGWQRWLFTVIALGASAWIIRLLQTHAQQKLFCLALAFILSGALGNVIDRILLGYVVDFLDFHWDDHHFAAFNVADAAINIGAALLIWDSFKKKPEGENGNITG